MFPSLYSDLFKPANASLQEQHVEFSMIYVMCVITFSKIHSKMFKTRRYAMFCLYKCIPMKKCPKQVHTDMVALTGNRETEESTV